MTFFNLGHTRSLNAVADVLDEQIGTIKKWSSRFRWANRIHAFNSGLLQQQAETEAALRAEQAADWARRTAQFREHEWDTSQKILAAVHCFLDDFSDRHVDKMTLSQVSRALQIASSVGRSALASSPDSGQPPIAPIQIELTAALKKAYSQAPPNHPPPAPVGTNSTGNQPPQ